MEALKATPPGKIADCIWHSRPLDGVAYYPPGSTDPDGNTYDYEEGWNMMTEDRGDFRRWPGMVCYYYYHYPSSSSFSFRAGGFLSCLLRDKVANYVFFLIYRNSVMRISRMILRIWLF